MSIQIWHVVAALALVVVVTAVVVLVRNSVRSYREGRDIEPGASDGDSSPGAR